MSGRGSTAPAAYASIVGSKPRRRAQDADRGHILEREGPGVDQARRAGQPHVDHALAGFDQLEGHGGKGRARSTRRSRRPTAGSAATASSHALSNPRVCAKSIARARSTHQVHLGPRRAGEHRDQQPDRPRPEHQKAVAGMQRRRLHAAIGVSARLDQGAERVVDACPATRGERWQAPPAARRARPVCPPRMPISVRNSHTHWYPARHRRHSPQPSIVSPVTRRPSQRRSTPSPTAVTVPIHSWPMRIGYSANPSCRYCISPVKNSTSVPHTPARATCTTTSPGSATRRGDILNRRLTGTGDDEGPHPAARPLAGPTTTRRGGRARRRRP